MPKQSVNIEMSSCEASKLKATLLAAVAASVCLGTFDIILIRYGTVHTKLI